MSNFKQQLINNYNNTFVNSLIPAINKKFAKGNIDRIELVTGNLPGYIVDIKIYDKDNNLIKDEELEAKIKKYWKFKKKAFEKNSDYYAEQRKAPKNQHEQKQSLVYRSLGEENSYFNY